MSFQKLHTTNIPKNPQKPSSDLEISLKKHDDLVKNGCAEDK
jgi:hypothetical protein